ncbi:E3 ubiquitin-protein ligase TRIM33-like [Rhopilema esculentum]|uniref:E3 ubiquitin-protein ligase TRIM33-like n=1 Tax=Rhopilema esculentum TaxID=499914 RepID=UPI0031DC7B89
MANIEEIITCGICLGRMINPRMLHCQHSFCLNCLASIFATKYIEKKTDGHDVKVVLPDILIDIWTKRQYLQIKCPFCNVENRYTGNLLHSALPRSLIVTQLQTGIPPQQDDQEQHKCRYCEESKMSLYECCECDHMICESCFNSALGEVCRVGLHFVLKRQNNLSLCLNHSIELTYHCNTCNRPLCCDCFIQDHGQHDVVKISEAEKQIRKKLEMCKSISDINVSNFQSLEKEIQNYKYSIDRAAGATVDRIKQQELVFFGIITSLFKEMQEEIFNKTKLAKEIADTLLSQLKNESNQGRKDKIYEFCSELEGKRMSIERQWGKASFFWQHCIVEEDNILSIEQEFEKLKEEKMLEWDSESIVNFISAVLIYVKEKNFEKYACNELHGNQTLKKFFSPNSARSDSTSSISGKEIKNEIKMTYQNHFLPPVSDDSTAANGHVNTHSRKKVTFSIDSTLCPAKETNLQQKLQKFVKRVLNHRWKEPTDRRLHLKKKRRESNEGKERSKKRIKRKVK